MLSIVQVLRSSPRTKDFLAPNVLRARLRSPDMEIKTSDHGAWLSGLKP